MALKADREIIVFAFEWGCQRAQKPPGAQQQLACMPREDLCMPSVLEHQPLSTQLQTFFFKTSSSCFSYLVNYLPLSSGLCLCRQQRQLSHPLMCLFPVFVEEALGLGEGTHSAVWDWSPHSAIFQLQNLGPSL